MPCDDCSRAEKCPPCADECSHESWREERGWRECADCHLRWVVPDTDECVVQHHVHNGGPDDYRLDTCRDDEPEPPDSASSSLDELCVCGHPRVQHGWARGPMTCALCPDDKERPWRHDFTPAKPEAPECSHDSWEVTGERHTSEGWLKWRKCADCREPLPVIIEAQPHWSIVPAQPDAAQEAAMQALLDLRQEMEQDEPACLCGTGGAGDYEGPLRDCPIHGEPEAPKCSHPQGCLLQRGCADSCAFGDQLRGVAITPRPEAQPPSRPPYAVAYQAGDGQLYEVALAGDAVATVEHGVLKVSHPSGVASIIQIRPMEGA